MCRYRLIPFVSLSEKAMSTYRSKTQPVSKSSTPLGPFTAPVVQGMFQHTQHWRDTHTIGDTHGHTHHWGDTHSIGETHTALERHTDTHTIGETHGHTQHWRDTQTHTPLERHRDTHTIGETHTPLERHRDTQHHQCV